MANFHTTVPSSNLKKSSFVAPLAASPTLIDFYKNIATALQFPDYFGNNLDALNDMLLDLAWLKRIKHVHLVIEDYSLFLNKEDAEKRQTVLQLLDDCATTLATGGAEYKKRLSLHVAASDLVVSDLKAAGIEI
jgi:RNAse (barnase) inhibitor barstar